MPSFAKANNPSADPLGALDDVWKNKDVDIVADLMQDSRRRAAAILRTDMPRRMLELKELIKSADDESSPFWKGHVHQGDFVRPQMLHHSVATGSNCVAGETGIVDGVIDSVAGTHLNSNGNGIGNGNGHAKSKPVPVVLPEDVAAAFPTSSPADIAAAAKGEAGEKEAAGCVNGVSKSPEALAEKKANLGQHWFEVVPRNMVQGQCIDIALREFEAMYDIVNELKLWLEMEIPVIEDGNSFGTEIQQHLITQLVNANKAVVSWENAVRQHYTDRAKYVAEWVKTPNVEDWALTIAYSDRFDHHLIRGYLVRALTVYAGLLTKFERNWEKVLYPKGKQGNASVGMY